MKSISPFPVWFNGANVDAEYFAMKSIDDNLEDAAQFYWQLFAKTQDADGNDIVGQALSQGNLTMSGQDYSDWGDQSGNDINGWAYTWAANLLNITIL
jgi:hypothetical protein